MSKNKTLLVAKNDPVCYAGGIVPTVKAKFRVSPKINSARISAETVGASSPLGGLGEQAVAFADGVSDWTEFSMASAIARMVRKADHRWERKVSKIDGRDVTPFAADVTGPHRVYTVFNAPSEPWTVNAVNYKNPWTNALEFVCMVANGESDKVSALANITFHLFYNMGFRYDTRSGESKYFDQDVFAFSAYLMHANTKVNCYDQTYGVVTLGNLLGIHTTPVFTQPFGFINMVNIVGVGPCNNPFFTGPYTGIHISVAGQDDTNRSSFGNHMYVFAEGSIFDACAGAELGTKGLLVYLKSIIDSSTEEELLSSFFSPYDILGIQRKIQFKPRNYKIQ